MTSFVLDAGALIAVDRGDRDLLSSLFFGREAGFELRTNAMVVAQVWRDAHGRQATLARFLQGVEIYAVNGPIGRAAGELLGATGTSDAIDATVVLLAQSGDSILTSDVADIERLVAHARRDVAVIAC